MKKSQRSRQDKALAVAAVFVIVMSVLFVALVSMVQFCFAAGSC